MTTIDKPIFKHDCPDCEFIASRKGFDMYFCKDFLIGRYGDEPNKYIEAFYNAKLNRTDILHLARELAIEKGVIAKTFSFVHNGFIVSMMDNNIIPSSHRRNHIEPAKITDFTFKATGSFPENIRMAFSDGDLVDGIEFTLKIISN